MVSIERLLRDELVRYADAVDHRTPVNFGLQVIRPDSRRRRGIAKAELCLAAHHSEGRL